MSSLTERVLRALSRGWIAAAGLSLLFAMTAVPLSGGTWAADLAARVDSARAIAGVLATSVHRDLACAECHRKSGTGQAASMLNQPGVAGCGRCHEDEASEVAGGIHQKSGLPALSRFQTSCTVCHSEPHRIGPAKTDRRPHDACLHCHDDRGLASRVALPAATGASFLSSVHGKKRSLGLGSAPDCAKCHGAHRVKSLVDDGTAAAVSRRVRSCAQCHPGATPLFSASFSHDTLDRRHRPVAFWIVVGYSVLIALVIAFFTALILLEVCCRIARKVIGREIPAAPRPEPVRFCVQQRLQHGLVVASFLLLVFTGIPLLAAGVAKDAGQIHILGGVEMAGRLHRCAGVALIAATVWHLFWLVWQRWQRKESASILPGFADVREFLAELRVMLLLVDRPAERVAKYGWVEKLEYWAFGWGVAVMGVTGLLMWFPVPASRILPLAGLPVVQLIHGYEAILATVSVFLWHLYQVHLKPGTFPMNWTWLTGRRR